MNNMNNQSQLGTLNGIFPCPVYIVKRDVGLSPKEDKDIEDIIKEGLNKSVANVCSVNTYIFNNKLKEIKQFCEQQIKIYVKEVISDNEELDFYITQSWLNITKPGENHHQHFHPNSIISGVFYMSTTEADTITFHDPNFGIKNIMEFPSKKFNVFNSHSCFFNANINELVLFPSWLSHSVAATSEKAVTDRISLSFNTFVRGTFGESNQLAELILK